MNPKNRKHGSLRYRKGVFLILLRTSTRTRTANGLHKIDEVAHDFCPSDSASYGGARIKTLQRTLLKTQSSLQYPVQLLDDRHSFFFSFLLLEVIVPRIHFWRLKVRPMCLPPPQVFNSQQGINISSLCWPRWHTFGDAFLRNAGIRYNYFLILVRDALYHRAQ